MDIKIIKKIRENSESNVTIQLKNIKYVIMFLFRTCILLNRKQFQLLNVEICYIIDKNQQVIT